MDLRPGLERIVLKTQSESILLEPLRLAQLDRPPLRLPHGSAKELWFGCQEGLWMAR